MSKDPKDDKKKEVKLTGSAILSQEEKDVIAKEVEAQLAKEAKSDAEEAFRDELLAKAKRKALMSVAKPGEQEDGLFPIYVNVPSCGDGVRLEGKLFENNKTYYVTANEKAVILECMGRGQEHEDSINGKTAKENMYRKKNSQVIQQ